MLSKIYGTWRTGSQILSYSLLMMVTGEQAAGCKKSCPQKRDLVLGQAGDTKLQGRVPCREQNKVMYQDGI